MYGFAGHFRVLDARWVEVHKAYSALPGSTQEHSTAKRIARKLRFVSRSLRGKRPIKAPLHFLWELEAVKQ